jgi:predicted nucleotidyltransferase
MFKFMRVVLMLFDELSSKKQEIEAIAASFGANRIRVFGSVARGEDLPDSDIDFLVDFDIGYDLFAQRLALADKLAELTGKKIDLIPEHELNRYLAQGILKEARYL